MAIDERWHFADFSTQEGVGKLERVYHMPLSKPAQLYETVEQMVRSVQVIAALLGRILYFLTTSSISNDES